MRMERWDIWLTKWAEEAIKLPYKFGTSDCVTLCRGALTMMLQEDPWADLGEWKSKTSALKMIREVGDPVEFVLSHGAEEVGRNFATAGDIALLPTEDDYPFPHMALVLMGAKALVSHPEKGVRIVPLRGLDSLTRIFRHE